MYIRSITVGALCALALNLPMHLAPRFALDTTGAVQLSAVGHEAQYGVITDDGTSILTVSLGATGNSSSLQLRMPGVGLPAAGRYPIRSTWNNRVTGDAFHAFLAAGSPEHPLGWFHGESGTVTITRAAAGRLSGSFQIRARGFLTADTTDAEHWVTVTGSFEAKGDSTTTIAAAK